jgi:hypothetical protein
MSGYQSETIEHLSAALAAAQGVMKAAAFNRINPHFKNRYADLASVLEAIRDPFAKNGLSITQTTHLMNGADFVLRTTLRHASGQWVASEYPLPRNAKPQELGSALTYARRYTLSAIAGTAGEEDDDGQAASASAPVAKMTQAQVKEIEKLIATVPEDRLAELSDKIDKFYFGRHGVNNISDLPATEAINLKRSIEKFKTTCDGGGN